MADSIENRILGSGTWAGQELRFSIQGFSFRDSRSHRSPGVIEHEAGQFTGRRRWRRSPEEVHDSRDGGFDSYVVWGTVQTSGFSSCSPSGCKNIALPTHSHFFIFRSPSFVLQFLLDRHIFIFCSPFFIFRSSFFESPHADRH